MPSTGFYDTRTVKAWAEKLKQEEQNREVGALGARTATETNKKEFKED